MLTYSTLQYPTEPYRTLHYPTLPHIHMLTYSTLQYPTVPYITLHPGNKQNVQLALNTFHETTVAAVKSYFLERTDAIQFFKISCNMVAITNYSTRYSPDCFGNAIIVGDKWSF